MTETRYFSFGGGVDSMAVLVLSGQGKLPYTDFVFANVGNDSEGRETFDYIEQIARPYAAAHGLRIHEINREFRDGRQTSLYQQAIGSDRKFIGLPMYSAKTGKPMMRVCTTDWKINPVAKFMRGQGFTKTNKTVIGIGFAAEEGRRAKTMVEGILKSRTPDPETGKRKAPRHPHYDVEFPLIELGLDRAACQQIILDAGLPVCPRSCCWWCPFRTMGSWREIRANDPLRFAAVLKMEAAINRKLARAGVPPMYFTRSLVPLDRAVEGERSDPLDTIEAKRQKEAAA